MKSKIYKIDKDTLQEIAVGTTGMENIKRINIQHFHDASISVSSELPFSIEIAKVHAPFIKEEEFMVAFRTRVDATARGPHDSTIENAGEDKGKENYINSYPHRPLELPEGFIELKGE